MRAKPKFGEALVALWSPVCAPSDPDQDERTPINRNIVKDWNMMTGPSAE